MKDKRKRPYTRAKLTTISTDTYACQTCCIPTKNYFRAISRLIKRHFFSTDLIINRYFLLCAPFTFKGTCVRSALKLTSQNKVLCIEISRPFFSSFNVKKSTLPDVCSMSWVSLKNILLYQSYQLNFKLKSSIDKLHNWR